MALDIPEPRFVAIEGGDGSGKTSVRKLLFGEMVARGRMPLSLSGVAWTSADATEIVTKAKYLGRRYPRETILKAVVADRRELHKRFIDKMRTERDVFSDRYLFSDVVYNRLHYGIQHSDSIAAFLAAGLPQPDLLIFLDTPPDLAVSRLKERGRPVHHWETLEKQERVASGFGELLAANPFGWTCPITKLVNTDSLDTLGRRAIDCFFDPSSFEDRST